MTQWGLDVLFNPAKRHMDEEKLRLQSTREEAGDASKGNRIDLASGKVTIRRKAATDDSTEAPQATDEAIDGNTVDASVDAAIDPVIDPVAEAIAEAADATRSDALTDATYAVDTDEEAS